MAVTHDDLQISDAHASEQRPRPPGAVLYLLWGLFCALMISVALRDYFRGGGHRLWEPLLWEGSSMLFVTGLLIVQRRFGRKYSAYIAEPARWFGHHLKWLPLAVFLFVVLVYGTRHGVYALLGETYRHESWVFVFPYETIKVGLFVCLWLGVIFSFDSYAHVQDQQRRVLLMQRSLSEARLSQLATQLRPHFFFNVLNTISALMHLDVARADRLLTHLGDLLRSSLESTAQDLVSLREEMRLLELYAQIMLERFADRATVQWQVAEDALTAPVPALLLQPLLENAFKHGVERTRARVCVEVIARRQADRLVLIVRNTGLMPLENVREGVGLRNCRERLQVIYGGTAVLSLSANGGFVEASISLPWREQAA
jgi:two-component system, LytTR family, sensor kinase